MRYHVRINRSADDVWKVVSDAGAIADWFPGMESSSAKGDIRTCSLGGGVELEEKVVTNDNDLRRFQYTIVGGPLPITSHLATVDVLEDGDGALVVYGCDIEPAELAGAIGPALEGGVKGLKEHLEG